MTSVIAPHMYSIHPCSESTDLRTDGVWDQNVPSIGPYAFAHTKLTEIQVSFIYNSDIDLLKCNWLIRF